MADNNKTFSNKQEAMVADALGGYQIGGSGAMPTAPGDVKTYDWLVECKTHTTTDHTIFFDIDVWEKIKNEAMGMSRKPVLIVDDGSQSESKTWCLCNTMNLNLSRCVTADLPGAVKKNISFKHEKLVEGLKGPKEEFVDPIEFYEYAIYETSWGGSDVCIMPLSVFKELFEQ